MMRRRCGRWPLRRVRSGRRTNRSLSPNRSRRTSSPKRMAGAVPHRIPRRQRPLARQSGVGVARARIPTHRQLRRRRTPGAQRAPPLLWRCNLEVAAHHEGALSTCRTLRSTMICRPRAAWQSMLVGASRSTTRMTRRMKPSQSLHARPLNVKQRLWYLGRCCCGRTSVESSRMMDTTGTLSMTAGCPSGFSTTSVGTLRLKGMVRSSSQRISWQMHAST
mmetsp:Transcript_20527/g.62606  ORF Transcript_20527/g.62606 Transcript_20527/m.62606 type:complete len:220 (-) Transcript_20527:695-1354(-)